MRRVNLGEVAWALALGTGGLWVSLWLARKAGLRSDLAVAAGITGVSLAIGLLVSGGTVPITVNSDGVDWSQVTPGQIEAEQARLRGEPRPKVSVIKVPRRIDAFSPMLP